MSKRVISFLLIVIIFLSQINFVSYASEYDPVVPDDYEIDFDSGEYFNGTLSQPNELIGRSSFPYDYRSYDSKEAWSKAILDFLIKDGSALQKANFKQFATALYRSYEIVASRYISVQNIGIIQESFMAFLRYYNINEDTFLNYMMPWNKYHLNYHSFGALLLDNMSYDGAKYHINADFADFLADFIKNYFQGLLSQETDDSGNVYSESYDCGYRIFYTLPTDSLTSSNFVKASRYASFLLYLKNANLEDGTFLYPAQNDPYALKDYNSSLWSYDATNTLYIKRDSFDTSFTPSHTSQTYTNIKDCRVYIGEGEDTSTSWSNKNYFNTGTRSFNMTASYSSYSGKNYHDDTCENIFLFFDKNNYILCESMAPSNISSTKGYANQTQNGKFFSSSIDTYFCDKDGNILDQSYRNGIIIHPKLYESTLVQNMCYYSGIENAMEVDECIYYYYNYGKDYISKKSVGVVFNDFFNMGERSSLPIGCTSADYNWQNGFSIHKRSDYCSPMLSVGSKSYPYYIFYDSQKMIEYINGVGKAYLINNQTINKNLEFDFDIDYEKIQNTVYEGIKNNILDFGLDVALKDISIQFGDINESIGESNEYLEEIKKLLEKWYSEWSEQMEHGGSGSSGIDYTEQLEDIQNTLNHIEKILKRIEKGLGEPDDPNSLWAAIKEFLQELLGLLKDVVGIIINYLFKAINYLVTQLNKFVNRAIDGFLSTTEMIQEMNIFNTPLFVSFMESVPDEILNLLTFSFFVLIGVAVFRRFTGG